MLNLVIRRVIATIPVMLVVATVVFLLLRFASGDPARVMAGDMASEEEVAALRAEMGLDQSIPTQYLKWIGALAGGSLGVSALSKRPVVGLIGARLEPTLSVALSAVLLTIVIAVPLGVTAAVLHGRWIDHGITASAVLGFSMPSFVVGYLMIWVFAVLFDWLPVQGYSPWANGVQGYVRHLVLPATTLAITYIAVVTRFTRTSMLDTLGEDFVRTARAKGATELVVLFRHALRNAAVPIVTIIGISLSTAIGGVVVIETVFNVPGVGRLMVDAVLARDYPVVQGTILFFSFAYILINLAIDIAYVLLDPRIRY